MRILSALTVICTFLCMSLNAQVAPDFTVTDIEGNEINLHSILDEGKVVVLDCSATWCGPCWQFHEGHFLKDIHEKYGPDGTDQVRVIFYEADPNTGEADLNGSGSNTLGDWVTDVPYPIVNENPVQLDGNIYWPLGYPTINVIRPDDKTIVADLYDPWFEGLGLAGMEAIIEGAFPTTSNVVEAEALNISVFPNPVVESLNVNLEAYEGTIDYIEIVNVAGVLVDKRQITPGTTMIQMDMSTLASGQYVVQLSSEKTLVASKSIFKQ